mgnify:CR=1 FL=1
MQQVCPRIPNFWSPVQRTPQVDRILFFSFFTRNPCSPARFLGETDFFLFLSGATPNSLQCASGMCSRANAFVCIGVTTVRCGMCPFPVWATTLPPRRMVWGLFSVLCFHHWRSWHRGTNQRKFPDVFADRTAKLFCTEKMYPLRIFAGHLSDVNVCACCCEDFPIGVGPHLPPIGFCCAPLCRHHCFVFAWVHLLIVSVSCPVLAGFWPRWFASTRTPTM